VRVGEFFRGSEKIMGEQDFLCQGRLPHSGKIPPGADIRGGRDITVTPVISTLAVSARNRWITLEDDFSCSKRHFSTNIADERMYRSIKIVSKGAG